MDKLRRTHAHTPSRAVAGKIEALGWGLFFIWIGLAFLADVGWSAGILGVGLIAVGTQAARKYLGLPVELFGLVTGLAMTAWGAANVLGLHVGVADLPIGFIPVLFIALGIILVLVALRGRPRR